MEGSENLESQQGIYLGDSNLAPSVYD